MAVSLKKQKFLSSVKQHVNLIFHFEVSAFLKTQTIILILMNYNFLEQKLEGNNVSIKYIIYKV